MAVQIPFPALDKSGQHIKTASTMTPFKSLVTRYFYFAMSLLIAAIVIWGFSHTIGDNLSPATRINARSVPGASSDCNGTVRLARIPALVSTR